MRLLSRLFGKPDIQYASKTTQSLSRKMLYKFYQITDYNPDQVLRDRGKSLAIYDRMARDPLLGGIEKLKTRLAMSADWEIKGPHKAWTKKKLEALRPITFVDTLKNLLQARRYGFKVAEVVWGADEIGKLCPEVIKCKHSHNIQFHTNDYDDLEYFWVGSFDKEQNRFYPARQPGKYIIYTHPFIEDGNWYGTSDYQCSYREWWAKDIIVKFRNLYLQAYGMPFREVLFDKNAPAQALQDLWDSLDNWQENFELRIPCIKDEDGNLKPFAIVNFKEAAKQGTPQFNDTIKQLDSAMAHSQGMPEKMGMTESDGGSYSLGRIQFEMLLALISDEHKHLSDAINDQLLKPMIEYNWANAKVYDKLHFVGFGEGLTEAKAKAVAILVDKKMVDPTADWVNEYLGVPALTPEEKERLQKKAEAPPPVPPVSVPSPGPATPTADVTPPGQPPPVPEVAHQVAQDRPLKTPKINYTNRIDYRAAMDTQEGIEEKAEKVIQFILVGMTSDILITLEEKHIYEGKNLDALSKPLYRAKWKTGLNKVIQMMLGETFVEGMLSGRESLKGFEYGIGKDAGWPEVDVDKYLNRDWLKQWVRDHKLGWTTDMDKAVRVWTKQSFFITGEIDAAVTRRVKHILFDGMDKELPRQLSERIRNSIKDYGQNQVNTIVRTNTARAWGDGRMAEFQKAGGLIQAYQYSAILDSGTTVFCWEHHGHFSSPAYPEWGSIQIPNHYRCRSTWLPVFVDEEWTYNWNDGVTVYQPQKGFGV